MHRFPCALPLVIAAAIVIVGQRRRPEPKVSVRFTIADGASDPVRVVLR